MRARCDMRVVCYDAVHDTTPPDVLGNNALCVFEACATTTTSAPACAGTSWATCSAS
jgi:hypothetical protein